MKLLLKVSIYLLLGATYCSAQNNMALSRKNEPTYAPIAGLKIALLGAVIHPGLRVGVERPLKYTKIEKIKTGITKTLYKERYLSYSGAFYHHKNFHTNFLFQTEWITRKQKTNGLYLESSLGAGISRTFVNGATFTVTDNGSIVKEPLSGNWYGVASLGGGIGYNANLKNEKPFSFHLKNQLLIFFPHNSLINLRQAMELGCTYNLAGFWKVKPKYKLRQYEIKKNQKI